MKRLLFCLLVLFHFDVFAACRANSGNHVVMKVNCGATPGSCSGVGTLNGYPAYGTPAGNSYCGGYGWMYCPVTDLHVCDNQDDLCNARPDLQQCANECTQDRADCLAADGTWSGSVMTTTSGKCCSSVCDLCSTSSQKKIAENKRIICCAQEMAPPGDAVQCQTRTESKCGMTISKISSNAYEYACRDPNLSAEAAQAYFQQCLNINSSSSVASSSSSSDGGGGGSGSSAACGEECDWLRWILDTLTTQREIVEDIHSCLTNRLLCDFSDQDSSSTVDSSILDGVKTRQDSLIQIGGEIRTYIKSIDSLMKLPVNYDTTKYNDSSFKNVVAGGFESVSGGLNDVTNAVNGVRNRLDSVISHIPDSILDSILKYQKYNDLDLDTIKAGFGLVDSLIDSTVTYFRLMHKYDSIRHVLLSDSLGSIHDAINGVAYGIGEQFGYGDTASSTLRKDVNAIGDTLSKYLKGVGVDTGGVSYGSGFVASGQRMGDSIKDALGWGYVDTLNIDSLYARALNGYKTDSISQDVQDSLNRLGMRLNDSLVRKTDSIKNALPAYLDSMADSLVLWAPFADFDSIIYSSIGAHIPNRSDCPEDCQKWTISIPIIGLHSYEVDFGLCLGRASFAGLSVLGFLKLLIRIIVAYTCIMTIGRVLVRMI